jgi:hypothetical protein
MDLAEEGHFSPALFKKALARCTGCDYNAPINAGLLETQQPLSFKRPGYLSLSIWLKDEGR